MVAGEAILSYLPYTHSFEQALFSLSLYIGLRIGYYQGNPLKLVEDCSVLKPHYFFSVPRVYNKIYGALKQRFNSVTGCKKWLLDRGINSKMAALHANGEVRSSCYDMLLFGKAAAMLGGNVRAMLTGSAPIDKQVIDFLKICFSCTIVEGYGLTESAAAGCVMRTEDMVTGHVGGPTEITKFRIKDLPDMNYMTTDKPYPRGELVMTGPVIFKGYFRNPEKTAKSFDAEGWFMTGDVVQIYPNGSVKIIDRSKNIFKLSQGEYIAPEKIENIMGLSPFIAQALIYGDSLKNSCVAVVVPEPGVVAQWARERNIDTTNLETLCANADLKKAIIADMLRLSTENKLTTLERPKDVHLSAVPFTVENGTVTPTFKIKRHQASNLYTREIDAMYEHISVAENARDAAHNARD